MKRLFTKVPEYNPGLGALALLLALFTGGILLLSPRDDFALLHLALALGLLSEAATYFLTDDQRAAKVKLRIAGFIWLIFVIVPLFLWMVFGPGTG